MAYKVISKFKDTDKTVYEVNAVYPAKGKKSTKKRIDELSAIHPKYKRAFIKEVKEAEGAKE